MTESHRIQIDTYSPEWPILFAKEREQLKNILGDITIEHMGSTSVPGLSAKPVIDMMGAVRNIQEVDQNMIRKVESLGYKYIPELEEKIPDRKFFQKRTEAGPWYHFSFVEPTSLYWIEHILFRDYLRVHPEAAVEYNELKRQLAQKHITDFDAYNADKTAFIVSTIEKARAEKA